MPAHAPRPPDARPPPRHPSAGRLARALVAGLCLLPARAALAQYKNISFGIDGGYESVIRPGIRDTAGKIIGVDSTGTTTENFPLRLSQGGRIGLESSLKLHSDHWWVNFRLNFHFLRVGVAAGGDQDTQTFDQLASNGIGTVLGLQPQLGLRYYLLTDRVRPFLQAALAYMRLFNFNDPQSCTTATLTSGQADTSTSGFCGVSGGGQGYDLTTYLPHRNVISLQATPAVEFIVRRDLALVVSCGIEWWIIWNAQDNWAFTPSLGLTIYG